MFSEYAKAGWDQVSQPASQPDFSAKASDRAAVAFGFAGAAAAAAVKDYGMVSFGPAVLRQDIHQSILRLQDIFFRGKSNAVGYAENVGIHGNFLMSETLGKNYVRSFSAYAGQGDQGIVILRDDAIVSFTKILGQADDIF